MRVRTFKPRFAPLVKAGTKRQTIRPMPKRMPKVGDHESWREWTGRPYWSPQRELAKVELTEVKTITLGLCGGRLIIFVNHKKRNGSDRDSIAIRDGFRGCGDMAQWFQNEHGLPFTGILIRAKDL